jgi:hypothetical protein
VSSTVTVSLLELAGGQQGLVTGLTGSGPYSAAMTFYGLLGTSYHVQRSTNLTVWTSIAAVTANATNGVINFTDTNAPESGAFYRFIYP